VSVDTWTYPEKVESVWVMEVQHPHIVHSRHRMPFDHMVEPGGLPVGIVWGYRTSIQQVDPWGHLDTQHFYNGYVKREKYSVV
jgi:hypothetical protein